MRITRSAISLNVNDPDSSAAFLERHLGFRLEMAADGFVSLSHEEAGFNVVFLRVGLPTFKPRAHAETRAAGLLIVFEVDDVDAAYDRMVSEGVPITLRSRPRSGESASSRSPTRAASFCSSCNG